MLCVLIGAVGAIFVARAIHRFRHGRFGYGGPFGYGMAYGGGCAGGGGGWHYGRGGGAYRSRYIDDDYDDDASWNGHGPWDGRGHGHRHDGFFLGALLARIDATPEQSKVIREAVGELRTKARSLKDDAKGVRKDLASAMRSEILDVETLGTVASRAGDTVDGLRDAAIGAILKVHQVLEPRQRAIVADALESRFGGFRGFGRGY